MSTSGTMEQDWRRAGVGRRSFLTGFAGAVAASGVLAACGPAGREATSALRFDQPTTITFWHPQPTQTGQALQAMVDKFNQTNDKQIRVNAEWQGQSTTSADYNFLFQKLQVALASGTPPDVSVAYENQVAEIQRANVVVDLDEYIKQPGIGLSKESLDDIFPHYLEGLRFPQYGNKLLMFPFTKSLTVMYVNEDVLQKAGVRNIPKTWQEFEAAIQQASRGDGSWLAGEQGSGARTIAWGNYASASTINAWAYSRGGKTLTDDNKQVRFLEPPYLDSFILTENAFKRGFAYSPARGQNETDFAANKLAFIMQSSTGRPFFRQALKAHGRERIPWRIANLPQKDPNRPATVQYGGNIAVLRTTEVRQAASWLWIKFFTERDQTVEWALVSGYLPVRRSAAEHPKIKASWDGEDPQGRQAFEISKTARPEPNVRGIDAIRPLMQRALQSVMDQKESSRAALEKLTQEANEILRQA